MKKSNVIASAAVAASLLCAGQALADIVDNPGEFLSVIAEGGAPGDYIQFLTFSTGANSRLPNGLGEFTFGVSDGATGTIDYGWYSFPESRARDSAGTDITYAGAPILVAFQQASAPEPLVGTLDGAHGNFSFTFTGRLRFRPEGASFPEFRQCVTPFFSVTVTSRNDLAPGMNVIDQIDLEGVTASTGTVGATSLCDGAVASAINSTFGLGSPTTFYLWKARFYPPVEGSY